MHPVLVALHWRYYATPRARVSRIYLPNAKDARAAGPRGSNVHYQACFDLFVHTCDGFPEVGRGLVLRFSAYYSAYTRYSFRLSTNNFYHVNTRANIYILPGHY